VHTMQVETLKFWYWRSN